MKSNIKIDKVQEIKEQMSALTVNLENIEFRAAQEQEVRKKCFEKIYVEWGYRLVIWFIFYNQT